MNKSRLFLEVVAKIQARPHVALITSAIESYARKSDEGAAERIHKMIRSLRDPKEYSVVVDVFFMKMMNENLQDRAMIKSLIDLREKVRVPNFTALAEIADDVDNMLKPN